MNVTQLANHLGVSKPTVYKRVKEAGLRLDELRDKGTKELTPYGVQAISGLFDNVTSSNTETERDSEPHFTDELTVMRERISALQTENALLREMLEAKEAERRRAEETAEQWRQMAERAQEVQLLLTAPAKKRGLKESIRGLFSRTR